jgi:hypothetical protein
MTYRMENAIIRENGSQGIRWLLENISGHVSGT